MIYPRHINLILLYQKYATIIFSKNVHLSHLNCVRKPSSARRSSNSLFEDVQEHNVSAIFHDPPKKANVFRNFYGIEGDEGVISVEELKKAKQNPIQSLMNTASTPTDDYKSFNFGAVRLDNENNPSYARRGSVKDKESSKKKLNKQVEKNLDQSIDHTEMSNLNQMHKIPEILFSHDKLKQITHKIDQRDQIVSSNVIGSVLENNIHKTSNSAESNNLSTNIHVIDPCKEKQLSHQDFPEISESYIDKEYFNEKLEENPVQIKKPLNNFLKDQFFKENNLDVLNSDSNMTKNNQKNSSVNIIHNFISHHKDSKSGMDEKTNINLALEKGVVKQEKYQQQECLSKKAEIQTSAIHTTEPQKNFIEEQFFKDDGIENKSNHFRNDGESNLSVNEQDLSKNVKDLTSKIISTTYEKNKLQRKDSSKKIDKDKSDEISTIKTDFIDESKKNLYSPAESPSQKVSPKKPASSTNALQEKESLNEKKIDTALDFVKQLRRNNSLTDDIKRGISAKKEKKVDSKGFRILKHQVPSLEYFTRDEILELLKSSVLYTDEDVVVLNKPYNLVIHESSTSQSLACLSKYLDDFAKLLDQHTNSPKLITVHRLDKETTGCLLLARNEVSAARLKSFFAQRKIVKTYWILTTKVPDPMEGIIDMPISEGKIENRTRMVLHPKLPKDVPYLSHSKAGKEAITQYSVIAVSGNAALVEVKPETGIKHQIRVHFGFGLGCPILGDHKYSYLDKLVPQKLPSDLLQRLHVRQSKVRHIPLHIHAKHVFIPQYSNEGNLFVTAPLPKHMVENLRFLKFKKK